MNCNSNALNQIMLCLWFIMNYQQCILRYLWMTWLSLGMTKSSLERSRPSYPPISKWRIWGLWSVFLDWKSNAIHVRMLLSLKGVILNMFLNDSKCKIANRHIFLFLSIFDFANVITIQIIPIHSWIKYSITR